MDLLSHRTGNLMRDIVKERESNLLFDLRSLLIEE